MNKINTYIIAIIVILVILFLLGPTFTVQEGELAVVARFRKIVRVDTEAGLKWKYPLIDRVTVYPKKIQSWDGEAQRIPTAENQFIFVDTTARWKIGDLKLFYESVGTIAQAHSRLDDVIDSCVRNIIAQNSLQESVRNSNVINQIERKNAFKEESGEETYIVSSFANIRFNEIHKGRIKLSNEILIEAQKITPQYGIILIDVIVRQIKYSPDLTQSVYERMIKDRNQIAQAFRSDGEGEKAKWLGKMEKELKTIQSDAEKTAKERKAKADAEALAIRNQAYNQDPEFADFWMAIEQYQNLLPTIRKVLTTDSEFFKYLSKKEK